MNKWAKIGSKVVIVGILLILILLVFDQKNSDESFSINTFYLLNLVALVSIATVLLQIFRK